jgi:hypothetical protein
VTAIELSPKSEKPPSGWSGWWLVLNPCALLNSLACRPLLWRRNVNDANNSAADNSPVDADRHLVGEAEAGHSALHAIVVMKTEWEDEVKYARSRLRFCELFDGFQDVIPAT